MNQILSTKLKNKSNLKRQFIVQFFVSITAILIIFCCYLIYKINIKNDKSFSESLAKNYQVYKLYAKSNDTKNFFNDYDIYGTISIPKINVNYPFFYGISEDLLKISPCRYTGIMPPEKSNLCIAGHNYNDNRFFGNINKLNTNDLIIIEDNNKNKFFYYVYEIYEISEEDLSFALNNPSINSELTLITCNNFNNKRIVVKAKQKA